MIITGANNDGYGYDSHGTWSVAWLGATPTLVDTGDTLLCDTHLTASYWIKRAFLNWDLSALDPALGVGAATVRLWVVSRSSVGGVGVVFGCAWPPFTAGDYQCFGVVQTPYVARALSGLVEGAYNDFKLDAAGIAYVKTRLGTRLDIGLREPHDYTNDPDGLTYGVERGVVIGSGRNSGKEPLLILTSAVGGKNLASDLVQGSFI